jgi:chemotaxis signal transduction protein
MESIAQHRMTARGVRVGSRICALRISYVHETMRPPPIEPVFGTPAFVRSVSIIRGVPVVDLEDLLRQRALFREAEPRSVA